MGTVIQRGLPPAPLRRAASPPIDLGEFDPDYAGWLVIIDLSLPLSANEIAARSTDDSLSMQQRMESTYEYISLAVREWNFVRAEIDDEGNEVAVPLPGPREPDGPRSLPQSVFGPLLKAILQGLKAEKN